MKANFVDLTEVFFETIDLKSRHPRWDAFLNFLNPAVEHGLECKTQARKRPVSILAADIAKIEAFVQTSCYGGNALVTTQRGERLQVQDTANEIKSRIHTATMPN